MKIIKMFENWVSTYTSNVSDYTNNVNLQSKDKSTELSKQSETEDEQYVNSILKNLNLQFNYKKPEWTIRYKNWTITITSHFDNNGWYIRYVSDNDTSRYPGRSYQGEDNNGLKRKIPLIINFIDKVESGIVPMKRTDSEETKGKKRLSHLKNKT